MDLSCLWVWSICVGVVLLDQSGSEDESDGPKASGSPDNPLAALQAQLKELVTAYDLVVKNNQHMTRLAQELETSGKTVGKPSENVALVKLTCSAVVKV